MIRIKVDLPEPLDPKIVKNSLFLISKLIFFKTEDVPYFFDILRVK